MIGLGGAFDPGGHGVGGVAGDGVAVAVVVGDHAAVGVSGRCGDVSFALAGVEGEGDEGVSEAVGRDALGDVGLADDPCHDSGGAAAVHARSRGGDEERARKSVAHDLVDEPRGATGQRDGLFLAALAGHPNRADPAPTSDVLDVDAGHLRHPQAVEAQQTDQGVIPRREVTGDGEEIRELRAGQPDGARGSLQLRAAHEDHGVLVDEPVDMGVLVEPGERVQPGTDGRRLAAVLLESASEELDLLPSRLERVDPRLLAPLEELPQSRLVRLPGALNPIASDEGHGVELGPRTLPRTRRAHQLGIRQMDMGHQSSSVLQPAATERSTSISRRRRHTRRPYRALCITCRWLLAALVVGLVVCALAWRVAAGGGESHSYSGALTLLDGVVPAREGAALPPGTTDRCRPPWSTQGSYLLGRPLPVLVLQFRGARDRRRCFDMLL